MKTWERTKGNPNMAQRKEKVLRMVQVLLTEEELLQRGDQLGRLEQELDELEEKKKRVARDFKAKIDVRRETVTKISGDLVSKSEEREVECNESKNWTAHTVILTRMDTGEVVDERRMTQDERQGELFDEDDSAVS